MRANPLTPAMRTARFLNIALNFVIGLLFIVLIGMLILPFFGEDIIQTMEKQEGAAPSLQVLNASIAIGGSLLTVAYLYVAFVVKRIVKTTMDGDPFVDANISRLRITWVVILIVEVLKAILNFILQRDIITYPTTWFFVFIVAIMAEVFRIGLELKRDQEFTV